MKYLKILLFIIICFGGCKNTTDYLPDKKERNLLKYAEKIKLFETADSIYIHSQNGELVLSKADLPLKTVMIVPTSVLAFMSELDLLDKISGVSEIDFIYNQEINNKLNNNSIKEIGTISEIFVEKVIMDNPDLLITLSNPLQAKVHEIIENHGIKLLYIDEYEETNPLAKAEYIKIIGFLFGKKKEAEELFNEIEVNYKNIQKEIKEFNQVAPTVFANQIYGDIWYMPGGKSFQSRLFIDAGANYLWSDNDVETTLNLSFESVYEKAFNADIWINVGDFSNKDALVANYPNYKWFDAFKTGNIYNWSARMTSKGGNDYFEKGVVRPDWVLKDLASIFYPDLFPEHELFFYKKLE